MESSPILPRHRAEDLLKLIKKEIAHLGDVTQEDFDNQRKAYKLAIEYFERANITQGQNGLNLFGNTEKAQ